VCYSASELVRHSSRWADGRSPAEQGADNGDAGHCLYAGEVGHHYTQGRRAHLHAACTTDDLCEYFLFPALHNTVCPGMELWHFALDWFLITFCMSRRRRKMYCGHAHLSVCVCVCLSVCLSVYLSVCRGRMPTLLDGPGCNLGAWYRLPPSCALLGGFAIGARVALLWQHNANPSYKLASIPRYDDIVRTAGWAGSARVADRIR